MRWQSRCKHNLSSNEDIARLALLLHGAERHDRLSGSRYPVNQAQELRFQARNVRNLSMWHVLVERVALRGTLDILPGMPAISGFQ